METAQTSVFPSTLRRTVPFLATAAVLSDIPSMPLISALVSETPRRQQICLAAPRIGSTVTMDDAYQCRTSAMAIMIVVT